MRSRARNCCRCCCRSRCLRDTSGQRRPSTRYVRVRRARSGRAGCAICTVSRRGFCCAICHSQVKTRRRLRGSGSLHALLLRTLQGALLEGEALPPITEQHLAQIEASAPPRPAPPPCRRRLRRRRRRRLPPPPSLPPPPPPPPPLAPRPPPTPPPPLRPPWRLARRRETPREPTGAAATARHHTRSSSFAAPSQPPPWVATKVRSSHPRGRRCCPRRSGRCAACTAAEEATDAESTRFRTRADRRAQSPRASVPCDAPLAVEVQRPSHRPRRGLVGGVGARPLRPAGNVAAAQHAGHRLAGRLRRARRC